MSTNRPFSMDELRVLPINAPMWIEWRPDLSIEGYNACVSEAHEGHALVITDEQDDRFYPQASDTEHDYCRYFRAWPSPPSVQDIADWPWQEVPADG